MLPTESWIVFAIPVFVVKPEILIVTESRTPAVLILLIVKNSYS